MGSEDTGSHGIGEKVHRGTATFTECIRGGRFRSNDGVGLSGRMIASVLEGYIAKR